MCYLSFKCELNDFKIRKNCTLNKIFVPDEIYVKFGSTLRGDAKHYFHYSFLIANLQFEALSTGIIADSTRLFFRRLNKLGAFFERDFTVKA